MCAASATADKVNNSSARMLFTPNDDRGAGGRSATPIWYSVKADRSHGFVH